MAPGPTAGRRSESSQNAIFAATAELCSEGGYRRMTIEAIAARAGVGKSTIYRWWPSKGAVVLDLIDHTTTVAMDPPDTGDLASDLRAMLVEVIDLFTPLPTSLAAGLVAEALQDPELGDDLRERLIKPRIAAFEQRLQKAQAAGQLSADADLGVALDLLYGPIYHRLALHLGMPEPDHLDSLIAHVLRALSTP